MARDKARVERSKDPRPNILFVFTDQQTAQALSCAGNPHVNTPHMDALAARGIRFTSNYCAAPVCGPSRSAMVTGRMPHDTGVVFNGKVPDESIETVGHALQRAGYRTTWIGKWHLPESFVREDEIPGFEHVPVARDMGWPSLARGDMTDMYFAGEAYCRLRWDLTKSCTPWMLTVSLHNPHDICYYCMDKPTGEHPNSEYYPPLPANFEPGTDEPQAVAECRDYFRSGQEMDYVKDWDETQWRAYLDAYYRMTQTVDTAVGMILQGLEESGMADNTLVVLTSDHGEAVAAHRMVCKNTFYEEAMRVPLIVSWPDRLDSGVTRSDLTSGLDLVPTFCDYAETTLPKLPGRSLRGLLEKQADLERTYIAAELAHYPLDRPTHGRMIRSENYKYCAYDWGEGPEQLYDLKADPGEMRNLACREEGRETLLRHRQHLREWCELTRDPFGESVPAAG